MKSENQLKVVKWPFFLADGLLVGSAGLLLLLEADGSGIGRGAAAAVLLFLGAVVLLIPYIVEFCWQWQDRTFARRENLERSVLAQIRLQLEEFAGSGGSNEEEDADSDLPNLEDFFEILSEQSEKLSSVSKVLAKLGERLKKSEKAGERGKVEILDRLEELIEKIGESEDQKESGLEVSVESDFAADTDGGEAIVSGKTEVLDEKRSVETVLLEKEKPVSVKPKKPAKPKIREEEGDSFFSTATVVATAFIGAGNKLFIRGEGPGLDWEKGVPMQFVEIGKWSWTTNEAEEPVRLQIFKNDEEADSGGILTLESGQTLSVRPEFEG